MRELARARLTQLEVETVTWTRPPSHRLLAIGPNGERQHLYIARTAEHAYFVANVINEQLMSNPIG